ncbi:MAG TPA: polymer-forming cytoskeletal protein [Thermoanaerobaculia bacterium]|nr:polymer-forming cytoskeletal protein [Thermoanaerobaculia bacterium]
MAIFAKDTPPPTQSENPRPSSPPGTSSLIGVNLTVDGTVTGDQALVVEGTVKGNVQLRGDLRIGPGARVEATVHAKNVVVEGTVIGDLSAENRIELVATATVEGNIRSPKIIVAEGATFRGSVDMGSVKPHE